MPKIYMAWRRLDGISGHEMGRLLLAELYDRHVGGRMPAIAIAPKGKPYFVESPWHFSVSHSKRHAFCLLSDVPVGVDAEELDRKIDLRMAQKLLSAGELAQFEAAADQKKALLSFWVLKEATAKHNGEGIRIHPNHTNFSLPDSRVQEIDGCLVAVVY